MNTLVNVEDFGLETDQKIDSTFGVLKALEYCKTIKDATLYFPKGKYEFWTELAYEKLYCISNHDEDGLKRITFPLINMNDIEIDGQGSDFIFHGLVTPFSVENSSNVHIKNINMDWQRPMHSQGQIIDASNKAVDIQISKEFPYEVKNNNINFIGEGWEEPLWGLLEIDEKTLAPTYGSGDNCLGMERKDNYTVQELKQGIVRINGCFNRIPEVGNYLVFRHGKRTNPGIFIQDSSNVSLENINIYHAGGMGVIAQKSEDISLKEVNVKIREKSNRVFTTAADATHFVNCKGLVQVQDCLFENQMDDATNVHGIYTKIIKKVSKDTLLVSLMHPQHKGVVFVEKGDEVGFIRQDSMLTYAKAKVDQVERINKDYTLITLTEDLLDKVKENDGVENLTWNANFHIKNCVVRANRARGLLISTPGEVIIEENTISTAGAAIKISGDVNSWYESGAVKNVLIRNNEFIDCNYCAPAWGKGVIAPIILALMINEVKNAKFKSIVQTLTYLPHFLSWVIVAGLFYLILDEDMGIFNGIISSIGFEKIPVLREAKYFWTMIISTSIWKEIGYGSIIYLAALTSIDTALYEAATVDGASKWQQIKNVTIPGIMPTISVMLILTAGKIAKGGGLIPGFDAILNMQNPMVYESALTLQVLSYFQGIVYYRYSYAAAIGIIESLVAFVFVFGSNYLAKKFRGYGLF